MTMTKKKRVSKKNKISWRKHVDINDVEEFLEDKRLEERFGEKIEIRADKDIFQIDTKPEDESKLSNRARKRLALLKPPKCFSLLQPLTKVPDPLLKRNRVRTKEERMHPIAKRNEEKRKKLGIVKAKEKMAAQNREHERRRKLANKHVVGEFKNDIWQVEDMKVNLNSIDKSWLTSDTVRHTHQGLGHLRKSTPKSVSEKKSPLEAVEPPHPGMSYNPTLRDHQELLAEVAQKEQALMKKEKHLERVTTKMYSKTTLEKKENAWLTEMSAGLSKTSTPEDEEPSDSEVKSINPPSKNIKKNIKQKRKQKEQRQLEKLRLDAKIEKKKIADIYKLKKINNLLEKQQKKTNVLKEKREKKKEYKKLEPKVLSKVKFQEADLDFQMGEDLSGSLRQMKTEGNLLKDRFKSLQKRNILQATVRRPEQKKPKYKKYERNSHKMGWESKGY